LIGVDLITAGAYAAAAAAYALTNMQAKSNHLTQNIHAYIYT
jgi:hypothetical protein